MTAVLSDRGVELIERAALVTTTVEDGTTRPVLPAAPEGVPTVRCRRMLTVDQLPAGAVVEVEVGFRSGDRIGDTTFEIRAHRPTTPDAPVTVVARTVKARTGQLVRLRGDLTHLAGEEVRLDLCVDATYPSGVTDAVWVDPRLMPDGNPGAMPVTIEMQRLCLDDRWGSGRIEPMLQTGLDEPYLLPICVVADGQVGPRQGEAACPTGVRLLSPRRTHGNLDSGHLQSGTTIRIPPAVGRIRTSITPRPDLADGLGSSGAWVGLAVAVMAEGATPTADVDRARRTILRGLRRRLDGLLRSAKITDRSAVVALTGRLRATMADAVTEDSMSNETEVFSAVDPDRHLGSGVELWSHHDILRAGSAGLPFCWRIGGTGRSCILEGVIRNG